MLRVLNADDTLYIIAAQEANNDWPIAVIYVTHIFDVLVDWVIGVRRPRAQYSRSLLERRHASNNSAYIPGIIPQCVPLGSLIS